MTPGIFINLNFKNCFIQFQFYMHFYTFFSSLVYLILTCWFKTRCVCVFTEATQFNFVFFLSDHVQIELYCFRVVSSSWVAQIKCVCECYLCVCIRWHDETFWSHDVYLLSSLRIIILGYKNLFFFFFSQFPT